MGTKKRKQRQVEEMCNGKQGKDKMIRASTKPSPKLFKKDITKNIYSLSTDYNSSKMQMIDNQWRELNPMKLIDLYKMSPNARKIVKASYDENAGFDFQGLVNFEAVGTAVDDMSIIEENVKNYVKSLERDGMPKSKVQSSESHSAGAGNGAFAADEIQKYEVVGIWSGDLFSKKNDDAVFHLGGSRAGRNAYIVELSKNANDNEFILDPTDPHGLVNDCQNWNNFRNAMTTLNAEEIQRFNLGWLEFKYKRISYMAEIALRDISPGNTELSTAPTSAQMSPAHSGSGDNAAKLLPADSELFTSYGPAYIPALLDDHEKDEKNRENIIINMKKEVKNILSKNIR